MKLDDFNHLPRLERMCGTEAVEVVDITRQGTPRRSFVYGTFVKRDGRQYLVTRPLVFGRTATPEEKRERTPLLIKNIKKYDFVQRC